MSREDRTPKHLRASNLGDLDFRFSDNDLKLLDEGVYLSLKGRFQKRHQKLESDTLLLAGIPEGRYELSLLSQNDEPYFLGFINIERGKTIKASVYVAGSSHKVSPPLFDSVLSTGGGRREGMTIYRFPDWNYWEMADGTRRYFSAGQALEKKPDGTYIFLEDTDDDLLEDKMDPRMQTASKRSLKDLLLGSLQRPFITSVNFWQPGSKEKHFWSPVRTCMEKLPSAGSLLMVSPVIHSAGGSQIVSVSAHVYKDGAEVYSSSLHDDGSLQDIYPDWPHLQVSGDEMASDQQFTTLFPISGGFLSLIRDAHIEFVATNAYGHKSQVLHCRMPKDEELSLNKGSGFLFYPKGFRMEFNDSDLKIFSEEPYEVVLRTKNSKKNLFPRKNVLNLYEYSDSVSVQSGSLIFVTVSSTDGSLFFTSERVVKK